MDDQTRDTYTTIGDLLAALDGYDENIEVRLIDRDGEPWEANWQMRKALREAYREGYDDGYFAHAADVAWTREEDRRPS